MARGKPYLITMQQGTIRLFRLSAGNVFTSLATQAYAMNSFDARLCGMFFTGELSPYNCVHIYGAINPSNQVSIQGRRLDDLSLIAESTIALGNGYQNAILLGKNGLFSFSINNTTRWHLYYWTSTSIASLNQRIETNLSLLNNTDITVVANDDLALLRITPPTGSVAGAMRFTDIQGYGVEGYPNYYTSSSLQADTIPVFPNGQIWNRRAVRFAPDNRKVILAGYNSAANESFVDIIKVKTNQLNIGAVGAPPTNTLEWKFRLTETVGQAREVTIHPSNKFVAVGFVTSDGVTATTKIYRIDGYKLTLLSTITGIGQALDFTADGKFLIDAVRRKAYDVASDGSVVENVTMMVNIPAGALVQAISKHVDQVTIGEAYDEGVKHLLSTDTASLQLKIAFLTKDAYFLPSHTTIDQVTNTGAYEVTGNDLAAGGIALTGVTSEKIDSNNFRLKANNFSRISLSNKQTRYAVIYDSATSIPIAFVNFAEIVNWQTGLKLTLPLSDGFVFYSK